MKWCWRLSATVTNKLTELDKRKEAILKSIEKQEKLTPALAKAIEEAETLAELEDIYLPYKPKRKTRATAAKEKGLEPLALSIFEQGNMTWQSLSHHLSILEKE